MGLRRVPLQSIQNFSKPSCHHDGVISMKPKNLRASLLAYSNKTIIEVQRYCKNLKSTIIFAFLAEKFGGVIFEKVGEEGRTCRK